MMAPTESSPALRQRGKNRGRRSEKGTVIYLVLIFVMAATTLVLISSLAMRSDVEMAYSEMNRLKAYVRCISGREFLENRLMTSVRNERELTDMLGEPLSPRLPLDGTTVSINLDQLITDNTFRKNITGIPINDLTWTLELQDSAGLLNAFALTPPMLRNLLIRNKEEKADAAGIISCLRDWMDPDDLVRPNGAEREYYEKKGYFPANRWIEDNEQLFRIKHVTRSIHRILAPLLDFTVENTGMNPNTMPRNAFFIFPGITDEKIGGILKKRQEEPFADAEGLTLATGYNFNTYLSSLQFFTSETTYVKIIAGMDEQRELNLFFRLKQSVGAGAMRRGQMDSAFLENNGVPEEDFDYFFHTQAYREGTQEHYD